MHKTCPASRSLVLVDLTWPTLSMSESSEMDFNLTLRIALPHGMWAELWGGGASVEGGQLGHTWQGSFLGEASPCERGWVCVFCPSMVVGAPMDDDRHPERQPGTYQTPIKREGLHQDRPRRWSLMMRCHERPPNNSERRRWPGPRRTPLRPPPNMSYFTGFTGHRNKTPRSTHQPPIVKAVRTTPCAERSAYQLGLSLRLEACRRANCRYPLVGT